MELQLEKGIKGTINKQIKDHLLKSGKKVNFNQSDFIFKQGDVSDHVYIILSGEVDILSEDKKGSLNIIETLTEGAIFGEMGMFINDQRTATVRAKTNLETVFFSKIEFLKVISKIPEFNFNVMKTLASRIDISNKRIVEIQQFKEIISVCLFLRYEVKVTKEKPIAKVDALELAERVNMHISQILKVLFKLEKDSIIMNLDMEDSFLPRFNIHLQKLDEFIMKTAYSNIH